MKNIIHETAAFNVVGSNAGASSLKQYHKSDHLPSLAQTKRRHQMINVDLRASKRNEDTAKSSQLDLPSLKRLVKEATTIHDQNLSCTPTLPQITSRLTDLEIESSSPSFWDASNAARNTVVTRDIAKYTRIKEQM
eukprot:scaffold161789_cov23-Cyclotella_meneghiniana.AAC.1